MFWLTLNSSRNFFGTLEFAGRSRDCDAVCCCLALLDEPVWSCLGADPKPTTNRVPSRFRSATAPVSAETNCQAAAAERAASAPQR